MPRRKQERQPIVIEFSEPVSDDLYLSLATVVMNLIDLAGTRGSAKSSMTIDPALAEIYNDVDPFGPARIEKAHRELSGRKRP